MFIPWFLSPHSTPWVLLPSSVLIGILYNSTLHLLFAWEASLHFLFYNCHRFSNTHLHLYCVYFPIAQCSFPCTAANLEESVSPSHNLCRCHSSAVARCFGAGNRSLWRMVAKGYVIPKFSCCSMVVMFDVWGLWIWQKSLNCALRG